VRALSAEVTAVVDYQLPPPGFNFNDPAALQAWFTPAHQVGAPFVFGNTPELIDTNSKLTYEDEISVGVQREVRPFLSVSLSYLHRKLGRTLEDIQDTSYTAILAGHGFGNYVITNPGPPLNPKPSRKYDAITLQIQKRLRDNWHAQASYTWSRLKGNYEGYFRRDNGQSDPFITSSFDFPYLLDPDVWGFTSADGFLPNDRTHVINMFGSYQLPNKLTVGLDLRAASGMPITPLGYNQVYGNSGEIVLAPRGSAGRGPWTEQVGVHFDYPIPLGLEGRSLEVALDVLNVFNQQKGIDFFPNFEDGGNVNPPPSVIAAGVAPCPTCLDPDFKQPTVYEDPRTVILSARLRF